MDEWRGFMDWPLNKDWKCELCGGRSLTWGFTHATCRCNNCHVQYRMRDKEDKIVDIPICWLKSEYYDAYKNIFKQTSKPVDGVLDEEWEKAGVKIKGNK